MFFKKSASNILWILKNTLVILKGISKLIKHRNKLSKNRMLGASVYGVFIFSHLDID